MHDQNTLELRDGLPLCDAMANFADGAWIEEKCVDGSVRVGLPNGLDGALQSLAARVETGEIECWARKNDPTAARERVFGLLHCHVADPLGIIESDDGGTRLYEPLFRVPRRSCASAMDEIRSEFERRYLLGELGSHPNISKAAEDLLLWAIETLAPEDGRFPKDRESVRVVLTNHRKSLPAPPKL